MDKPFAEVEAGLEKSGRVEDLIKLYDARSHDVPPPEGAPLLNKAGELARDRLKSHARAEEFFRRSLLLKADQREALLGLKALFEQKQDQALLADTLERLGASSTGPESATFYLRAADLFEQKVQRRDRAIFCCQKACRANPQDRASFRRVRALFLQEHKHQSAFDALAHERSTFGDEGMAEEFVAFAERLIDDPTLHDLVQRALGVAAELEPGSPRVEKAQKALEKFETTWRDRVRMLRGQSLEERDRKSAARLSLLVAKLFAWYDAASVAKVKEALDRCFLLWPAMPDALTLIEKIAERGGSDFNATVSIFERMAIDAKDRTAQVDLWIRTGTLKLTKLDDKGGGLDAFEKATNIDPSRADASGLAAELLLELGEHQNAITVLERHLATVKDRATQIALRLRLSDLCATLGRNVPAARVHLEAVLNLDGVNATAAYELARLYVTEGDAESLEPLVDLAVFAPRPVQDRVGLCEAAGMLFEETNNPRLAFQVLARALYLDPARVDILGSMLEAGKKAGVIPEMVHALQRAAGEAPPDAAAALWRSVANLAETPQARRQAWENVVRLAPDDRAAAEALAEAVADAPPADAEPITAPEAAAAPPLLPRITATAPGDEAAGPDLGPKVELKAARQVAPTPATAAIRLTPDAARTEVGVPVFKGEDPKARLEAEARRLEGSAADPATATAIYRQILEIAPDDLPALKRLGATSAALGQWEEVARVAARLGELVETLSERQEWRGRLAQLYAERLSRKEEAADLYLQLLSEGASNAAVVGGLERLASAGVRQAEISRALAPHYAKTGDYQRQVASLLVQLSTAQEMGQKKELLSLLAQTHERQLADVRAAFEFRLRGLQVDPSDDDFRAEAARLARELSAHTELSRVLSDLAQKTADAALSSALLVEAATLAEEGGSVDDAASALKLALEKSPDDPQVLAQLIQLYFKSGRFEDCDQVLRRRILLAEGEEKSTLYLKLADVSQELHRPREAAQALQEAIKAGAAEEPLLERLTELLEQGGRISELAAALQKQIELAEREGDQDKVNRLSLKRAQVLEAQLGDKGEALKNYSAILEQRPSDPDALAALEHLLTDPSCAEEAAKALIPAYEAVKEHRKLIHALEVVAESSQDDLEKVLALKKAAYVHLHLLRQPELAFASLARAMRLAPGDQQVRSAARQAAEDADQVDAFADVMAEALEGLKEAARVPLHRELAEVYEKKLAKREQAVAQLRAALALDGKNVEVLKSLQRLHRGADEWADLAEVLLQLAAVVPEPNEKVHLWREAAFLYEDKLADQEHAAAAWRLIAERDPLDRESAGALDQLYSALDKPQELAFALELRRAQEGQSPQGRELAYRLAQVRQHKLSDSAGALQLYRQIVTEDPGHKGARAALEAWVVSRGPVSAAALEILDPVLVQLSDHQKRVQLRETRMDGALPQEKARLATEICAIYERDLGQPELAFMAALRAFGSGLDQDAIQPEVERLAKVTGSFDALAEVYESAAANLEPSDERALGFQARAAELREQLGQPDEAVRLWRLVLEGSPQDRHALDNLGRLYEQSQNAKSLSEVYSKKAQLSTDPAERLDLLLKAGGAYEAAGDDAQA
ncbi:MAG TPA: tetratricopeptide repeat protein, partial [Myxococcales bacterium]|nr:tetratricopeptide repeat protein [Myxococcales bacterium]